MLYKFKSKDAGDVIMLEANGRKVLEIIGKDAGPKGIILPEQMPAAIAALKAAIAHEEAHDANAEDGSSPATAWVCASAPCPLSTCSSAISTSRS
jgi:hypothetical protein